jgi:PadR family transcriptional regulator PadR
MGDGIKMQRIDLLQGTLAMLILKALERGASHGYQVARTIELATDDVLRVEEGSLYPALHRMQQRGWIRAKWGKSENNRKAKFYELTKNGRAQLENQTADWERYASAVEQMLQSR